MIQLIFALINKYFHGKTDKGGEVYVHHLYTVADGSKWLAQSYGFSDRSRTFKLLIGIVLF